jgi:hypothetical protein
MALVSGDVLQVQVAMDRLRIMVEVLDCFEGTHSFDLVDHQEHIRRIFDLVLGSTAFEVFVFVLSQEDNYQTAPIKVDVLKVLSHLTAGYKYFSA